MVTDSDVTLTSLITHVNATF